MQRHLPFIIIISALIGVFLFGKAFTMQVRAAEYCAHCGCSSSCTDSPQNCWYVCPVEKGQYGCPVPEKETCSGGDPHPCPEPYDEGNCCVNCGGGGGGDDDDDGDDDTSCVPTSPAASVLMSPVDGTKAQTASVTLQWEPTLSWGVNCAGSNIYQVCVDSDLATISDPGVESLNWKNYCRTYSTTTASGVTSAPFTPASSGTYYWRVIAFNGSLGKASVVRSISVPSITTVTGRVYASNGILCDGTDPAVGYAGGTMVMSNTDGLSGYAGGTETGVQSSATFTVPGNTTTGYQYSLGFSNDDTNWIMKCPLPASHTLTVTDQPIERSFYVTQVADPWWQVAGGDVAAPGNIVQKIPGAATQPYGSYATASLDSGAFIAGNTIDTNNYSVGSTTNWKVQDSPYHVSVKEGYSYFMRIAEMGVSPQDDFTAGEAVTLTHDDLTKDPANLTVDDRKGLYHRGDVTLGDSATPIVIAANEKVILFVNGNVTVDGNITVANGGYLAVITNGNITFSENSYTAHGQYVADGFLIVRDAAAGDGAARQFVGEGNFVGWRGVTLERSLEPATDPLANNQNPAELFIYRPDLLFNTPLTLKYGSIEWREVAPRQLQ